MIRFLDLDLLLYGVMLLAMGAFAHRLAPDASCAVSATGIAGGTAAVLCGALGFRGFWRRAWPIAILITLSILLAAKLVLVSIQIAAGKEDLSWLAVILAVLLVLGVGQLLNFWQEFKEKQ